MHMSTPENYYLEFRGLQNILKDFIYYLYDIQELRLFDSDMEKVGSTEILIYIDGFLVDNQSEIHRFLSSVKKNNS